MSRLDEAREGPVSSLTSLVEQMIEGDPQAFQILYERYNPVLRRVIQRLLHSDRSDALQDVWIALWIRRGKIRAQCDAELESLLKTMAIHLCLDKLRYWARQKKRLRNCGAGALDVAGDPRPRGSQLIRENDEFQFIKRQLEDRLKGDERLLMELVFEKQRSYDEIAQQLGVSRNALGVRIHRLKARLEAIGQEFLGDSHKQEVGDHEVPDGE